MLINTNDYPAQGKGYTEWWAVYKYYTEDAGFVVRQQRRGSKKEIKQLHKHLTTWKPVKDNVMDLVIFKRKITYGKWKQVK